MSDDLPNGLSEVPLESTWFGYASDTNSIEKRYRLSADAYYRMLAEQEDRCAICEGHVVSVGPLYVDHDHDHPEKVVRGLLCNACNLGLGHLKHDPTHLANARVYLLERGCATTRRMEQYEREGGAPEMVEGTTELELHFLDGSVARGSIPAIPRLGLPAQTFDKYGREWRVAERNPLPLEFGFGAEHLVCHEVSP